MTKAFSMVTHKNCNPSANDGFVIYLTSKLFICFIDEFTSKKEIPINCLFIQWKWAYIYIYMGLDLENEVHSMWIIWTSDFWECKGQAMVGGLGQGRDNPSSRGRGSCFSGVAPTCHHDECNAYWGYSERLVCRVLFELHMQKLLELKVPKNIYNCHTCAWLNEVSVHILAWVIWSHLWKVNEIMQA